jgi:hypothetical protein
MTPADLAILRAAGPELVHERICALVAQGRVAFSVAIDGYSELMRMARGEDGDR